MRGKPSAPFLGTCGGFQHAVIEFARDVMAIDGADHAETNTAAANPRGDRALLFAR